MPTIVAPMSRVQSTSGFSQVPWLGLGLNDHYWNEWWIERSDPHTVVILVWYALAPGGYPLTITFFSESGFTFVPGQVLPSGIVSSIGLGTVAQGGGAELPFYRGSIQGVAPLGLSIAQVIANPAAVFAGDDTFTGGNGIDVDEIYAGDGNDTIYGGSGDGVFDLGRGNGLLDGGEGGDFGRFDMSDRSGPLIYTHNDTEAFGRINGEVVVTLRNVERVEIIGTDGYDQLIGGASSDILDLGRGGGLADGGPGDQRDLVRMDFSDRNQIVTYVHEVESAQVLVGGVAAALVLNAERVVIRGGSAGDTLVGGEDDDELFGNAGADTLNGSGGSDILAGGDGDDTLIGGGGYDYYLITGNGGRVDLRISGPQDSGQGLDTISGFEGALGSAGNDVLIGNDETNTLRGHEGDDVIYGYGGNDLITGGTGYNIIYGGDGDDRINGIDTPYLYTARNPAQGSIEAYGEGGNDIIMGANGDDILDGGDGDDQLYSFGGQAVLRGGAGNDYLLADTQNDELDGGSGNDILIGEQGDDRLIGGDGDDGLDGDRGGGFMDPGGGNDYLYGGAGRDSLSGSGGDDWLRDGSADNDTLNGGIGFDVADYSDAASAVTLRTYVGWDVGTGGWGSQNTGGAGVDKLVDIEGLVGSRFDDHLYGRIDAFSIEQGWTFDEYFDGGDGNDFIEAGDGNDTLFGGSGADTLNGGDDNDVLLGGGGNDAINGGNGYDIAGYGGVRRAYVASATSVSGGVEGGIDTLTGVEDLAFTDGRLTFARDGQAAQVMRLYDAAFNRSPDQSGFEALLDTLENGSLTLQQLADAFIASTEFQSQYAGLTNQQFVEQLYQFCLNRAGDSGGIQTWTNALNGGMSRGEVLLAFSESSEHKDLLQGQLDQGLWVADEQTLMIARLYDATYDRLPDQGGLTTWRNALGGGMSLIAIAQAFATAPEFQARYGSLSNQAFVELMYQLCLNRNGDAQGIQTWTNALNGGMSRGEVLYNFSESSEHIALTRPTWLGGVPCIDVAQPAPVLPDDKHHDDGGAQVIPMVADAGTDASHDGKEGGAQVLPGADTAHDGKTGPNDGAQVIPVTADGADTGGKDAGPQVLPGATDDEAPVAGKDTAPLILPGVIDSVTDDGFLLAKTDGDTGPQILPGAADDGADFLFDMGGDAVDAGHDLPGLEHRLAMLFIETGEHAPGLDTGADSGPLDLHHNPDPWAA